MSFLQALVLRIRNDDIKTLEALLIQLSDSINKINAESARKMIMILLKECVKYDRRKCTDLIIRYFAIKYYPNNVEEIMDTSPTGSILDIPEDEISEKITKILFSLIQNPTTEPEVLKYCFILMKVGFADILMEVLLIPDPSSVSYCINCIDILGELTLDELEHYQKLCKDNENYLLADFFRTKLNKVKNYQIIPDYMYNFLLQDDLPTEEDCEQIITNLLIDLEIQENNIKQNIDKISDEELTLILTSGIGIDVFDVNQQNKIRADVLKEVKTMTKEQKIEKLDPFLINSRIDKLKDNLTVFRILGPIHQIVGINYEKDDIYKHCMFTCDYYDWNDEEEDYTYWFTESCDYCSRKIRRRAHAVREPQFDGGWRGCFCSWKCVDDNYNELIEKQPGMNKMIATFAQQMETYGIQDCLLEDIVDEMKNIESRRLEREGKVEVAGEKDEQVSVFAQIPESDREFFDEIIEFQIEQDNNYEDENIVKLEDLIESHYLFGKIGIDQPLNVEEIIIESEKVVPISPSSHNSMIIAPDPDELNRTRIQESMSRVKNTSESEIPVVSLFQ